MLESMVRLRLVRGFQKTVKRKALTMTNKVQATDAASWIREFIERLVASKENSLKNEGDDPAWGSPSLGSREVMIPSTHK